MQTTEPFMTLLATGMLSGGLLRQGRTQEKPRTGDNQPNIVFHPTGNLFSKREKMEPKTPIKTPVPSA